MIRERVTNPSGRRDPVRCAVVGIGRWGAHYLKVLAETPGAELASLCDTSERARAVALAALPTATAFARLCDLDPAGLDAVVIATPTESHAELACEAFSKGFHVLVEKPLAITAADALRVVSAARRAGRVIATGYQMVHHPGHRALVDAAMALGPVEHVRTTRSSLSRERQDPLLHALAPHDLATFALISRKQNGEVAPQCEGISGDGASELTAHLRSVGANEFTAELNWSRGKPLRRTEIFCANGSLCFDEASGEVTENGLNPRTFTGAPLNLQCMEFIQTIANLRRGPVLPGALENVGLVTSADAIVVSRLIEQLGALSRALTSVPTRAVLSL